MTPTDLKQLKIRRLQGVPERTLGPATRPRIALFMAEEHVKPIGAYPAEADRQA